MKLNITIMVCIGLILCATCMKIGLKYGYEDGKQEGKHEAMDAIVSTLGHAPIYRGSGLTNTTFTTNGLVLFVPTNTTSSFVGNSADHCKVGYSFYNY